MISGASTDFVIVCTCTQELPEDFTQNLKKKLSEVPLNVTRTEERKNSHYYFVKLDPEHLSVFNLTLIDLSRIYQVDIGCIPLDIFKANKKLVIFDMDSTLITAEVINEMAMKHHVGDKVKLITEKAMNGELDFDQSLKERVMLLKGFHRRHMEDILANLSYTPGVPEFLKKLKSMGVKTAIASGGFDYFARNIQAQLDMDYVFANDLEFEGDLLTGKVLGSVINAEAKERIVVELAKNESITLDQIVAIGDGANDIPMLLKAGLGIAIHAKDKVQRSAKYRINFGPMTQILSFMNYEAL